LLAFVAIMGECMWLFNRPVKNGWIVAIRARVSVREEGANCVRFGNQQKTLYQFFNSLRTKELDSQAIY